jgi:hypothetical protein
MLKSQGYKCKLCKKEINMSTKQTDHINKDGKKHIRGLLCKNCNLNIVGDLDQLIKIKPEELLKIMRHIGIKPLLKKIDRSIGTHLLTMYKEINTKHPYHSPFPRRNFKWCNHFCMTKNYQRILKDQDRVCRLCRNKETRRNQYGVCSLCSDHSHRTGTIRGLVCHRCNKKISHIDRILNLTDKRLRKIILYIGQKEFINSIIMAIKSS